MRSRKYLAPWDRWPDLARISNPAPVKPPWPWLWPIPWPRVAPWWSRRVQVLARPLPTLCLRCSAVSGCCCRPPPKPCKTNYLPETSPICSLHWACLCVWPCSKAAAVMSASNAWPWHNKLLLCLTELQSEPWCRYKRGPTPLAQAIWLKCPRSMNARP